MFNIGTFLRKKLYKIFLVYLFLYLQYWEYVCTNTTFV